MRERDLLNLLANYENIIINPSDKCGKIVVMDTDDYEKACLDILTNTEYYEEQSYDPNDQYKQSIGKEIDKFGQMGYIADFEHSTLNEGDSTPFFYGLPKLHKVFTFFPSFRPICSGSNSCTKRLLEWIDSFLKAAAQKLLSYVQGTTSFINKIKNVKFKENVLIATLDVESLCPNIDHEEGAKACEYYLNQENNQRIATKVLKHLILLILKINTMMLYGRYFRQTKGTAVGTPMAVNYANCFMGHFETNFVARL